MFRQVPSHPIVLLGLRVLLGISPRPPQEFLPKNRGHPNLLFSYLIAPFFSKCIRFLIHRLPSPLPSLSSSAHPFLKQASLSPWEKRQYEATAEWRGEGFTYLYLIYVYRISWYSVSFDSMARTLLYQKNKQQKSIVLEKSTLVVTSEFPWAWITYASQRLMGFWLGGRDPPRRKGEEGGRKRDVYYGSYRRWGGGGGGTMGLLSARI